MNRDEELEPEPTPQPRPGSPARGAADSSPLDPASTLAASSAAWIAAAQSGDGARVWTLLEERYQADLLLFARHQIGQRLAGKVEPQDLVQEAWLRVLRSLPKFQYQGPGSFRRWLKTQIAWVAKEEARRGGAGRDAFAPTADPGIEKSENVPQTSSSQSPSRIADRVERAKRVWEALHDARMPALYREVFIASAIEELPSGAIARKLGVKLDTVRQQMRRARLLLKGIVGFDP